MGLFNKIINVFYDDVEPEETKEEEVKVKEEVPLKREDISKPRIEEVHIPKTETKTFKFPMIDEEDEDLPIKRSRSFSNYEEESVKPQKREVKLGMYDTPKKMPERVVETPKTEKAFKPTPVISPV